MKVAVTGASGFTGGHLARALRKRGCEVRALVRDERKAKALAREGIVPVAGDLTNPADVRRAVEGCDVVYHIAALYREARHPDEMYRKVNVDGTRNVADACEQLEVKRLVHCSTVGVHGDVAVPADENAPFAPGDIYQQTKLEGEQLIQRRIEAGLPATIFRPVGIYGPGDLRFLKLFRAVASGTFRMIGNGQVYYHLTYIDDLVEGIILCGEHPAALGRTYILAGPRFTTLTELVSSLARALRRPVPRGRIPVAPVMLAARACEAVCKIARIEPPLHRRRLDFFIKDRGFSIARASHELGYAPAVELDEGFVRTSAWYYATGHL